MSSSRRPIRLMKDLSTGCPVESRIAHVMLLKLSSRAAKACASYARLARKAWLYCPFRARNRLANLSCECPSLWGRPLSRDLAPPCCRYPLPPRVLLPRSNDLTLGRAPAADSHTRSPRAGRDVTTSTLLPCHTYRYSNSVTCLVLISGPSTIFTKLECQTDYQR